MKTVRTVDELRSVVAEARANGKRIGCVPTMGALHDGHLSLVRVAREHSDFVVLTIFVNPTQFGPKEDFSKYPRPIEKDLAAADSVGVDVVFLPEASEMYPQGFSTAVTVSGISAHLEGAIRPTHFSGVATVVLKLFNQVLPDVAVFGAKDYQQQALIRQMVRDLDLTVQIVTAPILREPEGLAMSSRNVYLSAEQRQSALVLFESLELADRRLKDGAQSISQVQEEMLALLASRTGVVPDYAVICDPQTLQELSEPQPKMVALVAARLGTTRLIDNREITIQ